MTGLSPHNHNISYKASVNNIHVSGQPPALENWHRSRSHHCISPSPSACTCDDFVARKMDIDNNV